MLIKKFISSLTKQQKIRFYPEDKFADSGLIAICIIFIQNLISVEKLDDNQKGALIAFSIALPILAIHLFSIYTVSPSMKLPGWLAKIFEHISVIGTVCTGVGILYVLINTYLIAAIIYLFSSLVMLLIFGWIKGFNRGYDDADKTILAKQIIDLDEEDIIYD